MVYTKESIRNELKELNSIKQTLRSAERAEFKNRKKLETNGYASARLVTEEKNNHYSYYAVKPDGTRIYLKKKDDYSIIHSLAQRDYNSKLQRRIDERIKRLEKLEKICPQNEVWGFYNSLHPARKEVVSPIIESDEDYAKAWSEKSYLSNDFDLPQQTIDTITKNGEIVRSKSEKILADMFFDNGVPYRYEPELVLESGHRIFPDFVCLNKHNRKEFVWEHFGMMDNLEYISRNIPKLREYEQSGYLLGANLIISYETMVVGLSTMVIQSYIDQYLL